VRALLPQHMIADAERRALSIGLGADRVLICADAITEEAYLTALAASLGTSYEPLDRVSRPDCPLHDNELIQASAVGLLPLRERGKIVWIVAPRGLTARHLADPHRSPQQLLKSFRLTSSERLRHFVATHADKALALQAANELRRAQPMLSNAPPPRRWAVAAGVALLAVLTAAGAALIPRATIMASAALLCAIFLGAAVLRLFSALHTPRLRTRPLRIADDKLPIYTIICALYREANVVDHLVGAIRALDYPGIMAQTPQASGEVCA
jgi:glycosyltransferase XagB